MEALEMLTSMSKEMTSQRKLNTLNFKVASKLFFRKSNYDVRSAHPGNQEQIIIQNPVPGR